jgi:hypothetical protein
LGKDCKAREADSRGGSERDNWPESAKREEAEPPLALNNGVNGMNDMAGKAVTATVERIGKAPRYNNTAGVREPSEWSTGPSDIEGKATRVGASECGQRTSFNRTRESRRSAAVLLLCSNLSVGFTLNALAGCVNRKAGNKTDALAGAFG